MRVVVTGADAGGARFVSNTEVDVLDLGATVLHTLDPQGRVRASIPSGEVLPPPGGTSLVTLVLAGSGPGARISMHATPTVDYGVVLRGSAWLEMESGDHVRLEAGDVVVQDRTRHAWHNDGPEPCVLLFSMRGAPDDAGRSPR